MQFLEVLDAYKKEVVNPDPSTRFFILGLRETALQEALQKMEALKPTRAVSSANWKQAPVVAFKPAVAAAGSSVKDLIAFHKKQIESVGAIDRAGENIAHLRKWIFRQGAKISKDGKIVWKVSQGRVVYDTTLEQQDMTKLTVRNGLLYDAKGQLYDTSKSVTAVSGPGWAIYVLSATNNLHVTSHAVGMRHHSSLLGGGPVAGAGELIVSKGRLTIINNKSGHYAPPSAYLVQVVRALTAAGIAPASYQVREMLYVNNLPARPPFVLHPSAERFLAAQVVPVLAGPDGGLVRNHHYDIPYVEKVYGDVIGSDGAGYSNADGYLDPHYSEVSAKPGTPGLPSGYEAYKPASGAAPYKR